MKEITKSSFRLENFIIGESLIKRKPVKQGSFSLNIVPQGKILLDQKVFELYLKIEINDSNDSFICVVSAIGIFKFRSNITIEKLDNYFYLNAPAIIYPYIRAYISSLTSLSGLKTINLPLMNLSGITSVLKKNTIEVTIPEK